jgi:chromosome segregation ATPase
MEKILDMVNQNVKDTLKKFQDTKNKEHQMTQKQIRELREDLNRQQSETKDSIKREVQELERATQNIKEELITDWQNLKRKNQTEILEIKSPYSQTKNTMEGHSSRLEQVEERILELEDETEIREKTEKILVKQLRSCERNVQEVSNSIKRPNLSIMGIEEEEVQTKGLCNIFNKIKTEISQILKKSCPFRYRKPPGHQTDLTKIEPPHSVLSSTQQA